MSVSKVILKYTYTHTCQVVKWPDKVTGYNYQIITGGMCDKSDNLAGCKGPSHRCPKTMWIK